jgi:hypothetical protein
MQFSIIAATLFAGLVAASPAERRAAAAEARTEGVSLTYWAAAENIVNVWVPIDGASHPVPSDLSFTRISSNSPGNHYCVSEGIDGARTYIQGDEKDVPIGPPQVQTGVTCYYHY